MTILVFHIAVGVDTNRGSFDINRGGRPTLLFSSNAVSVDTNRGSVNTNSGSVDTNRRRRLTIFPSFAVGVDSFVIVREARPRQS